MLSPWLGHGRSGTTSRYRLSGLSVETGAWTAHAGSRRCLWRSGGDGVAAQQQWAAI